MSDFDPNFHLKPPTAKTVRECRLESMLLAALPYLSAMQLEQSSEKIAELVESIVAETT